MDWPGGSKVISSWSPIWRFPETRFGRTKRIAPKGSFGGKEENSTAEIAANKNKNFFRLFPIPSKSVETFGPRGKRWVFTSLLWIKRIEKDCVDTVSEGFENGRRPYLKY